MERAAAILLATLLTAPLLAGGVAGSHAQASPVDCTFPVSATDATGTAVTVDDEPGRLVVLAPSAAQTVWAIGAQDAVVGMPVNQFTAYLDGRENKTNVVGERGQPVREAVVASTPDLVLAPNIITNETVEKLRDALPDDVAVYRVQAARSVEDVAAKTELTGQLVGAFDEAARVAAETRGVAATIAEATADRERPTIYYALGGGWTAGTETFIGNLVELAGGENVAAAANITGYAPISQEVIAAEDPDWIVLGEGTPLPKNPAVNDSTAVEEGNVLTVDANFLNQPGPKTVIPLEAMARAFHPDAVPSETLENVDTPEPTQCEADASTPTTATTTTAEPTTATDEPVSTTPDEPTTTSVAETTSGSGPGFGVVATLVALLALLAVVPSMLRRD
ncbi:MAG: PGF-CTERM-anchored ABC transporter substrate-binding protein [Haloarculaceae archaeon]